MPTTGDNDTSIEPSDDDWQFVDDWQLLHTEIETAIQAEFDSDAQVRVLEAGCGTKWPLSLPALSLYIVGLDENLDAINHRQQTRGDLDECIQGDLVTAELPENGFDLIYCSYVLEHVVGAEPVMQNFVRWLRPGGLLVIKIPNRNSVFGFVTRMTPYSLHVWYKRYLMKNPNAGKKGHDPFPTVYDPIISMRGMTRFMRDRRLQPIALYKTEFYPAGMRVTRFLIKALSWLMHAVTFGRLRADHSGLALILRNPATAADTAH